MAEETGISWADSTANLWIGCQKVSPACDHCYAEHLMGDGPNDRMKRVTWGPQGARSHCKQGWTDIKRWNDRAAANGGLDPELGRRRRIFVNSLSDFFDNHPSVIWRGDAWQLIRRSPNVIFMLVTKRPQLIARVLPPFWDEIAERVWLLTTAENQEWFDRRVPELTGATRGRADPAVFGVSCEPLLGPIDMKGAHLDWVIVGGESGTLARPMHPVWAEGLRVQCAQLQIPFHFKQWGEFRPYAGEGGVAGFWLDPDGSVYGGPTSWPPPPDERRRYMIRAGKQEAGHLIDAREIQEIPHAA